MTEPKAIVEVHDLRKEFRVLRHRTGVFGAVRGLFSHEGRTVRAVDDVSFTIESGELVGYVGANGAGKSTTIKILVGILRATSGSVRVLGRDPHRYRRQNALRIGVVFGQRTQLWWDLPPTESFQLLGTLYRIPPRELETRRDELVDRLALGSVLDVPVRKLSLGQRMRCELTASLLHSPDLVILDEPTIGLDVVAKEEVRAFLRKLHADRGTTLILTSHDLGDIERLCSRVLVIDEGRLLHDGDVESLRRLFGHRRILQIDLRSSGLRDDDGRSSDGEARDSLHLPPGCEVLEQTGPRILVEFDPDQIPAPELIRQVLAQREVLDLGLQETPIEDVVRRIYRGDRGSEA
ncbi:MAG: ATP-binding cassette domain-containing protein [Candidatus Eisenbacteria bacterium]